ncbi:ATP-dependent helicase HrpB [Archangium violaceum]|uniref:ATP-dependent helicase HrpB n=1 Tax=Archangium violaceum TaxID=83451 RepID=UPI001F3AC593|nr:ATP-dependent helicase HrpB [Archangium violaceum]
MAGPMAGVSAAQIAQQKLQDQGAQQVNKQGASKFDAALANKAQAAGGPEQVQATQATQATQRAEQIRHTESVNKTEKAALNKVNTAGQEPATARGAEAVNGKQEANKVGNMLSHVVGELEKGQVNMDKLIQAGASGKTFSNAELLSLQAGMYKYTQELDLTSKVVEKATSGLKDTLKTQV